MKNNFPEKNNIPQLKDKLQTFEKTISKLKKSEQLLKNAVDNAPIGMVTLTINGKFRTVNKAFSKITGYNEKELLTMNISKITYPDDEHVGYNVIEELTSGKKNKAHFEKRYIHKKGNTIHAQVSTVILRDELGTPQNFFTQVIDVTERKQAEEALQISESKYRLLAENAVDFIFYMDLRLKFIYLSPYVYNSTGYYPEEVIGTRLFKYTSRKEFIKIARIVIRTIKNYKSNPIALFETKLINKKGEEFSVEISGRVVLNEKGKPIGLQGNVRDITEHKQAEEMLQESEEKFRNFVETSTDLVVRLTKTGRIDYVSPRVEDMYGYQPDELIGKHLRTTTPVVEVPKAIKAINMILTGKPVKNFEINQKTKAGRIIPMEINAVPVYKNGKIVGAQGIMRDITEQKNMISELMEREEKYKTLTYNLNVGVYRNTPGGNGIFIEANPAFLKMFGFRSKSELERWKVVDFYLDPIERKSIEEKLASKGFILDEEIKLRKKDGTIFFASISATSAKDELGNIIHYDGIIENITERKEMMERIIQERDRSQLYLDIAGVMFLALDRNGNVILANQKTCEIIGTTEENLVGKNWIDNYIPKDIQSNVKDVFNKIMHGKEELAEFYENEILTSTGDKRLVAWRNSTLKDESGKIFGAISSGLDVTEENKAREDILAYQSNLKSLTNELIVTEERARRRLAITLHDKLGQALILANFKADELNKQTKNVEHKKMLNEISSSLDEAINESKNITYELSPPVLYEMGLIPAIRWKLEEIEKNNKIKTSLINQSKSYELEKREQIIIYRSINELLQNVLKHAKSESVRVSFRLLKNDYRIAVSDDGIGFDLEAMRDKAVAQKKFGLFSIMERIRYIGGEVNINSVPNKRTKVVIDLPIKSNLMD